MSAKKAKKEVWSSQIAYILTAAGATIGFGCTWRFPYLVGQNGGAAFVLLFCVGMVVIGLPMILVENVIGRRMRKNSIDCFGGEIRGKKVSRFWKVAGILGAIGAFLMMAYYMVLGGWVLSYIYNIGFGNLDLGDASKITAESTRAFYNATIENAPLGITIATLIFVLMNYYILVKGVIGGIEKAAKILMPFLFLLMIAMVLRNLTLSGATQGIQYYLFPDFSKITVKLFVDVLGQVFFALSLGFGVIITLSTFMSKREQLIKTSIIACIINTLIAVLAGFIIFPLLFTYGVRPDSGPRLVFESLPMVFAQMKFGTFFILVFFLFLMIAAITSTVTIYEVIIKILEEKWGYSRRKATIVTLGVIFVLGNIPCALSSNIFKDVTFFGKSIFSAFDDISATIFFLITSFLCALFVGWILKSEAKEELKKGSEKHKMIINLWYLYVKFIIPIIILIVFISSFKINFLS